MTTNKTCDWHEGEPPVRWGRGGEGCPDCGRLFATKDCEACKLDFIDWDSDGFDDVVVSARVSLSGDVMCNRCLPIYDPYDEEEDGYLEFIETEREDA